MTCQGPRIHLSGPAYPIVRARYVKMSTARYNIEKKKKKEEEEEEGTSVTKRKKQKMKWEMTENAQVDKENNWALLHGHFLKSIAMWKAQL